MHADFHNICYITYLAFIWLHVCMSVFIIQITDNCYWSSTPILDSDSSCFKKLKLLQCFLLLVFCKYVILIKEESCNFCAHIPWNIPLLLDFDCINHRAFHDFSFLKNEKSLFCRIEEISYGIHQLVLCLTLISIICIL